MPARMRPPPGADTGAVLDPILACDVADLGVPDFSIEDLQAEWAGVELEHDARVAAELYVSVGMRPTWEAERREKALGA
ncbi:MAG: hypothetical protein ACRDPC_26720 [Solirubrobacteraceae bacterium]